MAYEIDGVEFTPEHEEKGLEYDHFAIYKNVVVMGGMVEGGVYDTKEEAIEAGRLIAQDLYGSTAEYHADDAGGRVSKAVATMTKDELEESLTDRDDVAFATVAEREVLFS
jgi:hypothetical protein